MRLRSPYRTDDRPSTYFWRRVLSKNGYDEPRAQQFIARLSERVAALPCAETVSFANIVAFSDLFWISGATPEGHQPQPGERLALGQGMTLTLIGLVICIGAALALTRLIAKLLFGVSSTDLRLCGFA